MKKRFTILTAALALFAVLAIPMKSWADSFTYDFSTGGTYNSNSNPVTNTWVTDYFTILQEKGTSNTAVANYLTAPRWYQNHTITITPAADITISSIVINCSGSNNGQTISASTGSVTVSGNNSTWTGSITSSTPLVLTMGKQCRPGSLEVTYTTSGSGQPTTYTVTYNANGGTGTMTDSNSPYNSGATVTVLANTFTRDNYTFSKWNTAANGSGTDYDAEDTFTINANTTLYAQWTENASGDEQWVLTNLTDLTSSDVFVIVGNNGSNYAMSNNNGTSAPSAVAVNVTDNKITSTVASTIKWNISGNATDGYTFYPNGSTTTWLYCTNTNNGVKVGSGDAKHFKLSINGYLTTTETSDQRYLGIYSSQDWRCYTSEGGNIANQTFAFYKKVTGGVLPPSITANNVGIAYDATSGEIGYSIINPVANATLNATTTANWLTIGTVGSANIPFTCSANQENAVRTATVTLSYVNGDETLATKDVTVTQAAAPLVYTTIPSLFEAATSTSTSVTVNFGSWVVSGVNGNQSFVTDGTNGFIMYQSGHGFEVGNVLSGTANCNLVLFHSSAEITGLTSTSEGLTVGNNGSVTPVVTTIDALQAVNTGSVVTLSNLTYNGTNLSDGTNNIQYYTSLYNGTTLESGKIYNITGIFVLYDDTKRILPRNAADIEEVISNTPVINASDIEITYNATSGEIAYTITNPVDGQNLTATTTADWITIGTVGSTSVPFTCSTNEGDSDRTATINLSYDGATDKVITVTQGHYMAPTGDEYALYTGELAEGDYLIVYDGGAMNTTVTNDRLQYEEVSATNNVIVTGNAAIVWHIAPSGQYWTIYNAEADAYAASTGAKNKAQMLADGTDDKALWTVSGTETYEFVNKKNTANNVNANLRKNGNYGFACYATGTGGALSLYKKVEPVTESITLSVPGYGNSAGGYHLIASPLATSVAPTAVTNMIDATTPYDLYRFNQDAEFEWQNYKGHTDGFVIEPGKAYLYAHETDVTLTFNGIAYNGNGTFNLTQSATNNTSNGGKMNALGNPYNAPASIGNRSFYKMNAAGTALETVVGGTIGALEGILVNYDANNPSVTFSTSKSRDVIELLTLNLQEQDNVIDNVIVRFDGGDQLLKYQIFDSSKIYFTVDGEDYAVVRGENQGTLPVNFVALSNGTYTISMDFENMTFSYLHLIDNLTGEDIDMLTTTSYSFDATTEDDANRFTLVYSKDGEGTTETLTFYDGDATSGYVPVYGFYADAYQKVEFIMPAEDLYALTGATINKMTWYLTTPAEDAWGGNFKIYLMETEATTPTDYANLTNATLVYDGPLDGTGETLEINFATSFFYEGNNLLVAVHQTETGTYKSATFAGSAVTGAALQGYNYSNLNQVNQAVRDFLPKTTFEFTPGSGAIYYKPKQLQASEIGITSAVLTWEAGDDETSWGVEYKKVTEDTWTDAGTVDQLTITLDNLEAGTEYEAHVKSIYTDGESGWTTIAFATEACEETDKGEVAYTLTDTYGDGWTNNKLKIFLSGTDIMIAELTLTTGWELEGVVKLCYDTDYDLVWVAGNYAYETGFVLTAPDGTIIYEFHGTGNSGGTTPTPGVLTTFQIHNGFTKTIEAYTDNSGYYLIASPVGNVLASEVTNMVDGNYDLYMFDQNGDDEGKQWLNYKASAFSYLEVGMGYLYASESDVTLTFSGTPISSDDDYTVEVNYNASSDFPGLNLLGNPFAKEAYLVNAEGNGLAYHRLNPANNTYVTVDDNSAIPMMEGVFYEAGENDDVVYFSATAPATSKSNLNITVSQGRGMVDNAIVRFGEGNTLRKISLRDNSTKVYIPQNGSEYALVNANEFGEMPVNFKAESNGTYTMSFSNQNVEFGYLHLIDNLTGADVDLLANPSYSFEAKVSDYASRFKLVFATGNDDSSSDFAFVSNDEIIVNGEGMLQVIDMTGRIISTSQVNGMSSIKLNAAAGVYVLRLNDKTQKIVIK